MRISTSFPEDAGLEPSWNGTHPIFNIFDFWWPVIVACSLWIHIVWCECCICCVLIIVRCLSWRHIWLAQEVCNGATLTSSLEQAVCVLPLPVPPCTHTHTRTHTHSYSHTRLPCVPFTTPQWGKRPVTLFYTPQLRYSFFINPKCLVRSAGCCVCAADVNEAWWKEILLFWEIRLF